jgi:hypothetical protein
VLLAWFFFGLFSWIEGWRGGCASLQSYAESEPRSMLRHYKGYDLGVLP